LGTAGEFELNLRFSEQPIMLLTFAIIGGRAGIDRFQRSTLIGLPDSSQPTKPLESSNASLVEHALRTVGFEPATSSLGN
jgi:hypothetical protein